MRLMSDHLLFDCKAKVLKIKINEILLLISDKKIGKRTDCI